jgi:hypothetical protein
MSLFKLNPIIGEIGHSEAVFIFVTKENIQVFIDGIKFNAQKDIPTRVHLKHLQKDSLNTVNIKHNDSIVHQVEINTKQPSSLALVSCDMPELETKKPLWDQIEDPLILHLGDNIYGDKVYHENGNVQNYRNRYIETWKPWNNALKTQSHLMIMDDHEIVDDYHTITDSNETIDAGFHACHEFQEALRLNNQSKSPILSHWIGDNLVYMVSRQLTENHKLLNPEKFLDETKNTSRLILCLSSPPLPSPGGFAQFVDNIFYGSEDNSSNDDILLIYDTIFKWIEQTNGKVVVCTGDLHIGIHAKVSSGDRSFEIYSTGPITNQPTPAEYSYASSLKGSHKVGDYDVEVFTAKGLRNYISLDLNTLKGTIHWSDYHLPKNFCNLFKVLDDLSG